MLIPSSNHPRKDFRTKWPSLAAALLAILRPECLLAASEASAASADEKNVLMWLGIAAVVGIAIAAAVLQSRDKLVVFRDYTDATISVLSFLVPFIALWILKSNQSDQTLLWLVSGGLLAAAVALMLINTADANGGLGNPFFYLALAAKLIFMVIFLLLVALIVAMMFRGSESRKYDNERRRWETDDEVTHRKKREAAQTAAAAAGLAGLIAGGFRIFCKNSGFGSPAPVFASIKRIFAGDLQAGSNQNALGLEIPAVPPRPVSGAICVVVALAAAVGWWHYSTRQMEGTKTAAKNGPAPTQVVHQRSEQPETRNEAPAQSPPPSASDLFTTYETQLQTDPPSSEASAENYQRQNENNPPPSVDSAAAYQPQRQSDEAVLEFNEALERANNGDAYAQAVVSIYYGLGYKTSKNVVAAADYASRSAAQGDPLGLYRMGSIVQSGDGVQQSPDSGKAMKVQSLRGLDQMTGDPYAMTALGIMLFRGEGVAKDRSAAARLYQAAAETGYAPALYNYAACLMAGHGVQQDMPLALQYWRAAYEQNYPPAMDGPPPVE